MAKRHIHGSAESELDNLLLGQEPFRVSYSYGTFTIQPKITGNAVYWYTHKRVKGKLYKRYIGKAGNVWSLDLHKSCHALHIQYSKHLNPLNPYATDYLGYE